MNRASMTRSLSDVQDILYYIFLHLDPDRFSWSDVSVARQTLLSSALTCKNFTRPALNALWRSLPSSHPLIKLLCALGIAQDTSGFPSSDEWSDLIELGIYSSYELVSTLEDPRTHPNWSRFREHTTRVRKITLGSDLSANSYKQKFWAEVSQFLHDEPILPLLHSVVITEVRIGFDLRKIPLLFISQSVRKIYFGFIANRDLLEEIERVVSEACARAPHLEIITLTIIPWKINLSVLHGNPHLRSITIQEAKLSIEDLVPLTSLAELEDLSITLGSVWRLDLALSLPSLRQLSLKGVWTSIHDLLDHIEAPHIRSLTLHATYNDSWQFIDKSHVCLQATSTKFSALEMLSVDCARDRNIVMWILPGPLNTEGTLMDVIEPLLSLSLLRHLTLDFHEYILRHTSDHLRRLAEALPNVEELVVNVATVDGSRAGFECIAHFARHCPRLHALHLPAMDFVADALDGLEYPEEAHLLTDLNVAEVMFPREEDLSHEMTAFVRRVFPKAAVPPFSQHQIVAAKEESGDDLG